MTDELADSRSMLELFRVELDTQTAVLTYGLLTLERDPFAAEQLESCMRAAHSLKGAARIVGLDAGVSVAHGMEDCFVAAQQGRLLLDQGAIDLLLRGLDWLNRIAQMPEAAPGLSSTEDAAELAAYLSALHREIEGGGTSVAPDSDERGAVRAPASTAAATETESTQQAAADRVLRVTAESLNRLLGLAGESLVESRWLKPFADSLMRLKHLQVGLARTIEDLALALPAQGRDERAQGALSAARQHVGECRQLLAQRLAELELFTRRANDLSRRLYDEALANRMRPFADRAGAFPRMVRDLGQALGKQVRLEVRGHATQVDRDLLEKLDAPLTHLLRNAVDHGIESPEERRDAGKPADATISIEARHSAGRLQISVADDGRGIALDRLRRHVVERRLTSAETAAQLSEAELLEFLFLPGFTLKDSVSEISGRGVGLDIVQNMIKQVRGSIRVHTLPGQGTRFELQLPLTLSVMRALLAEIGGEPYAFPLAQIARTLKLEAKDIEQLEGRQHFTLDGRQVGLATAHQILKVNKSQAAAELPVIVISGDAGQPYGILVDRLLGERELVVQPLDLRLGKIKDIAAAALMEDGAPVLILDIEDLIRSVDKLAAEGPLDAAQSGVLSADGARRKRVLVVDDSLTVRELERKLLGNRGYEVEVAVDGMDGWNAVRIGNFDLVVTDVDMPRLDGIELISLIRRDQRIKSLPILIVSYKDREEDRRRGLEAGADYYLTKGSFHDDRLLATVVDLIGEADA
jgi:two-component system sensor histidine kinase and response regulator WspE